MRSARVSLISLTAEDSPDLPGTPNWFNTVAPPVATFLAENNLAGKKIALFCTNGGGGLGHIVNDIRTLSEGVEILESLNLYEDGGAGVFVWEKATGKE